MLSLIQYSIAYWVLFSSMLGLIQCSLAYWVSFNSMLVDKQFERATFSVENEVSMWNICSVLPLRFAELAVMLLL